MAKIGIIAGTGIENLFDNSNLSSKVMPTDFGAIEVMVGRVQDQEIIYLNRHGRNYFSPSNVNYKGNIQALKRAGAEKIIATAAVGSLNPKIKPGSFVLLSDFLDFTRGRSEAFDPLAFTDVSFPYDEKLRAEFKKAAAKLKIALKPSAVYACTEGPRFESRAEIKMFRQLGADVVGMTQIPEVILAAEAGIPYAVIGVVTNYAAGISPKRISSAEVAVAMKKANPFLSKLILQALAFS